MKRFATTSLILWALLAAARADAQQMTLAIRDGRVTLDAQNVPVRQILAEWARLGGVKIVNGDKIVGPAVTLQLPNVPERQALDIILRGVSGYMLAARPVGVPGASIFDRILILPTSQLAPPSAPAQAGSLQGNPRNILPRAPGFARPFVPPDQSDLADAGDPDDQEPQVPREVTPAMGARLPFAPGFPTNGVFNGTLPNAANDVPNGTPQMVQPPDQPTTGGTPPASANNPFGLPAGSGRPGVVTVPEPTPTQGAQPR